MKKIKKLLKDAAGVLAKYTPPKDAYLEDGKKFKASAVVSKKKKANTRYGK